jgi:ceramide glucosyltransferase
MPYGILGFAAAAVLGHVWLGLALFAAAFLNRIVESWVIGWGITRDPIARSLWLYPLRDLLGFFVWGASYLGRYRAVWRNVQYDLTTDGRVVLRGGQPQSQTPK